MKKRFNITQTLAIAIITIACFNSCSNSNSENKGSDSKLGKIEVEIPDALKGNTEVVNYIKGMSEVADEYANMVDDMLEEYGEYAGMATEDLTMMEQIKLTKATAEVAIKSTEIMTKWAEYQEKRNSLGTQLSDDELKALESIWTKFEQRIEEISKKQEEMLVKKSEV